MTPSASGASAAVPRGATVFRRGDADASGAMDLTDALVVLGYLFRGAAALPCQKAGDVNDDGNDDTNYDRRAEVLIRVGRVPPESAKRAEADPPDSRQSCR